MTTTMVVVVVVVVVWATTALLSQPVLGWAGWSWSWKRAWSSNRASA
jgi:hypothetical protein